MTQPDMTAYSSPLIRLPDGCIGVDMPRPVNSTVLAQLVARGVTFVMRYVSRAAYPNPLDVTTEEVRTIRAYGLALGFVQHVKSESRWTPYATEGQDNGRAARLQLRHLRVPRDVTVGLDLEAVYAKKEEVIRYVNAWNDELELFGYQPGLYLGDHNGLTGEEAFHKLTSRRYWSAYNLDFDQYPAHRSVCLRQHENTKNKLWGAPLPADCNVNTTRTDAFGDRWTFWKGEETP